MQWLISRQQNVERLAGRIAIFAILAVAGYLIYRRVGLVADGSAFLVNEIVDRAPFYGGWPSRAFSNLITQAPVLAALDGRLVHIRYLIYLQSIGLVLFPSVLWVGALLRLYRSEYFWVIFCLYCTSFLNTILYPVSESNIALAIFIYLIALLISGPIRTTATKVLVVVLSFAAMKSYASTVATGPILVAAVYLNLRDSFGIKNDGFKIAIRRSEWWVPLVVLFCVASVWIGAEEILFPSNVPDRNSALDLKVLLDNRQVALTCLAALLYITAVLWRRVSAFAPFLRIAAVATLLYFLTHLTTFEDNLEAYFGTKSALCLYVAAVAGGLLVSRFCGGKENIQRARVTPVLSLSIPFLLFLSTVVPAIHNAGRFARFASEIRQISVHNRGFVDVTNTNLPQYRGYYWTYPFLSLILRKNTQDALVVYPKLYSGGLERSMFPDTGLPY